MTKWSIGHLPGTVYRRSRVSDPYPFHADPDPELEIFADLDPDPWCEIFAGLNPELDFFPKIMVVFLT